MASLPSKLADAGLPPELIHPALWRAHQLGRERCGALSTGFDELDAELPGGGWPKRALTELLLPHPGVGEMRLLAPVLAAVARGAAGGAGAEAGARSVMLFDPPAMPCAWALAELGVDDRPLVVVHGREGPQGAALRHVLPSPDLLWALEQALRSGHVGAVVAWLSDRLRAEALRRLQLAAQAHDGPVFLMRGIGTRVKPSPAPLRLALHPAGPGRLSVHLLKRRGPAAARPLVLPLTPVAGTEPAPRREPVMAQVALAEWASP